MLPNKGLLIAGIVVLGISSAGFFFAQFSRSTKKVHLGLRSSVLMFFLGIGTLVAALII
jgi:hypothetical protein